jgi:hypothetical protein
MRLGLSSNSTVLALFNWAALGGYMIQWSIFKRNKLANWLGTCRFSGEPTMMIAIADTMAFYAGVTRILLAVNNRHAYAAEGRQVLELP